VCVTRAIFVTQQIDPSHPNLGAVVSMVRALAANLDEVTVLALGAVQGALPGNCRVRTFGAGTQTARGARFGTALARELSPRPVAVIAHMSPIYAVLAAPLCRPLGVPVILWFTHWRTSRTLRLAERLSTAVATVDVTSFPFASNKVRPIGHGIDVTELQCRPDPDGSTPLRALALGRTSPAKGLEAMIHGVQLARERGVPVELEVRGPSETDEERRHREHLSMLAGGGVRIEPPVSHDQLTGVFARTDLLINAAAAGSLDKSVFEACASCVPVLASNPGFATLLPPELMFERGNAEQIADRIAQFAALSAGERATIGRELRERVEREHSSESWARAILALGR